MVNLIRLEKSYHSPGQWGVLGTHLFETVWKELDCTRDQDGICPLVYVSPMSRFPGSISSDKSLKKVVEMQPVIHSYSSMKTVRYFKEYMKALLEKDVFDTVWNVYEEEKDNYEWIGSFIAPLFACGDEKRKQ